MSGRFVFYAMLGSTYNINRKTNRKKNREKRKKEKEKEKELPNTERRRMKDEMLNKYQRKTNI